MSFTTQFNNNELAITGDLTKYSIGKDWWVVEGKKLSSQISSGNLIVDLSHVDRADSAGLAWLINLIRDTKANDISVVLRKIPSDLLDLAKISDASSLLPLE